MRAAALPCCRPSRERCMRCRSLKPSRGSATPTPTVTRLELPNRNYLRQRSGRYLTCRCPLLVVAYPDLSASVVEKPDGSTQYRKTIILTPSRTKARILCGAPPALEINYKLTTQPIVIKLKIYTQSIEI